MSIFFMRVKNYHVFKMTPELDKLKRPELPFQIKKTVNIFTGTDEHLKRTTWKTFNLRLNNRKLVIPSEELTQLWEGFYYTLFHLETIESQEEFVEQVSKLVHLKDVKLALLMFKCFLEFITIRWPEINTEEKYHLFARRILRQMLEVLKSSFWKINYIIAFNEVLTETLLKIDTDLSDFGRFISDIYLEELKMVANKTLSENTLLEFLRPFAQFIARVKFKDDGCHIYESIFQKLAALSEEKSPLKLGLDKEEKSKSEEEKDENTGLLHSKFNILPMIQFLHEICSTTNSTKTGRIIITKFIRQFHVQNLPLKPKKVIEKQTIKSVAQNSRQKVVKSKDLKRKRLVNYQENPEKGKKMKLDKKSKSVSSVENKELNPAVNSSKVVNKESKPTTKNIKPANENRKPANKNSIRDNQIQATTKNRTTKTSEETTQEANISKNKTATKINKAKQTPEKAREIETTDTELVIMNKRHNFVRNSGTWNVYTLKPKVNQHTLTGKAKCGRKRFRGQRNQMSPRKA